MRRRSLLLLPLLTACGAAPSRTAVPNSLRIPPILEPSTDGEFVLTMQAGRTEFQPGRPTPTWGINGSYLGPTIRVSRGDRVRMRVVNRLAETSTLHWHGIRLPARMDGGPHQMIEPGATWTPEWTVDQPAMTGWYHPHLHEHTAMHVYRGLAGLIVVDDANRTGLPGEYGVDDVPLILQDKKFEDGGQLEEGGVDRGTWGVLGEDALVNGTLNARFAVTTEAVRFRILNASNARVYRAGFTDGRRFHVVATDAGLLRQPAEVDRVKLSPGERAEIVVRFAPGEQVVLNRIGETARAAGDPEEDDFDLMTFVADPRLEPSPPMPAALGGPPAVPPPPGARVRTFRLSGSEINDRDMDMTRIDEVVPAGAHEIWEIVNESYAHNFHIHEVEFRILELNGAPPPAWQQGPKDTVFLPKGAKARLSVRFNTHVDPVAPYMYHCHILRHEDKGMMGQFVVVTPGTEDRVARTIEPGHHHD
ncbi:multicopper oxidase family protein [Actinoplanes couchii]|uniref:Multicopper oxidase n=1 Tax=Actinoplanes couchii TaxID=403638 RepID=A0ABQ3X7R7_9ACTN|nr:multicopper oxidase domain-containing protein [Actinoplanes couchii]MDR6320437.1 FtsP/CotA-like multicopper oxidase with cupredoxin domain [Actinoplanes couchii]GID54551.1 multicopper oxidase [Actinoplanes couchii]